MSMNFKSSPAPNISRAAWQADPTNPGLAALGDAGRTTVVVAVMREVKADRLAADPGGAATGRQA
jgi:hypothetical protein